MTMYTLSSVAPTTISRARMMFGCPVSSSSVLTSRSAVTGNPSFADTVSNFICLSATRSPVSLSNASHTFPYVPSSIA
jgi:hypothetical protein